MRDRMCWLPIEEAKTLEIPAITRTVLEELQARLATDPELRPGAPAPFYRMLRNRFVRDTI